MTSVETMHELAMRSPADLERAMPHSRIPVMDDQSDAPSSRNNANFPRSASYTYIPSAKQQDYVNRNLVAIKGSFSEVDLLPDEADISPPDSSGWTTPEEPEPKIPADTARDLIAELQRSPKISIEQQAQPTDTRRSSADSSVGTSSVGTSIDSAGTGSTVSSTPKSRNAFGSSVLRKSHRRSWYSTPTTSRSPSPKKRPSPDTPDDQAAPVPPPPAVSKSRSLVRRRLTDKSTKEKKPDRDAIQAALEGAGEPTRAPLRRRSTLRRKVTRPVSGIFKGSSADDEALSGIPAVPSLPKSFSTDRLPTMRTGMPMMDRAAPVPRLVNNDRTHAPSAMSLARKKDELWSVFRSLDGDHAKFSSKSLAFKANVVRTTLLPFLRQYVTHPSNDILRPEDLDRRANILNKWWTGLIEMLHGRNNQSISGTDRPAILDGIAGIMERPEWRLAPSPFSPLHKRDKGTQTPKNVSTTSLSSNHSQFLADSVHHNVRNIFIQNLSSQMAFVVDKMSLRNASASLVTFCGKACAYAFMFVPGMADVLVRLWDLQTDSIRRVLDENGIAKFENVSDVAEGVTSNFPPALQQLGFTSLMKFMKKLRTPPPLPLGTNHIQWWGYWLERWTGRESDLFYVFVKHFHMLVTDFLPGPATKRERMCIPGLVLVHAQILVNLDATIHRDSAPNPHDPVSTGATQTTFDDVLSDPDAVASTLPVIPNNATRLMAENRLIMLIRDFLSERAAEYPAARQLFAESFNDLLQAATRGTSAFDHHASYTLLDFLEEALVILVRFEHLKGTEGPLINSNFWQTVCKRMISSENTLTEVRLYAFLYTIWSTVVCDMGRKSDLCLGLLLDPEIFESRFNHWCPMVRAYFMRLLCWRVARYDGDSNQADSEILQAMQERLQTTWAHYMWLREHALDTKSLPPASNPCNPAPMRRFLVMRTDTALAASGTFLSFDGILPSTPSQRPESRRMSTLSHVIEMDNRPETPVAKEFKPEPEPEQPKGIRGFFRSMMGGKPRSKSQSAPIRAQSVETISLPPRPESAAALTRSLTDEPAMRGRTLSTESDSTTKPATHRNFSFKFSLEYQANAKTPGHMRLLPPRLPMPAQQLLQSISSKGSLLHSVTPMEPRGASKVRTRYCGRALAEWTIIVGECQSFFDRRRNEGVPSNKLVETPTLGVESFKNPARG